jgi:hypothetical protein
MTKEVLFQDNPHPFETHTNHLVNLRETTPLPNSEYHLGDTQNNSQNKHPTLHNYTQTIPYFFP